MKCVKCQKEIGDGEAFCGYCGTNQAKFSKYITKVEEKIHKERDKEYQSRVNEAQNELNQLKIKKQNEINRITSQRWKFCGVNTFSYNVTEGKIKINGTEHLFSEIKGAEKNTLDSFNVVTHETGTTKKHASIGKAIVGGAIMGPLGAAAGSTLGKSTTSSYTTSNATPICSHIGVIVDLNGFKHEIVILDRTVNQSSKEYKNGIEIAQSIISVLEQLSKRQVPEKFLKPEEEKSVLDYNILIENATKKLEETIANKPTYEIPQSYYMIYRRD